MTAPHAVLKKLDPAGRRRRIGGLTDVAISPVTARRPSQNASGEAGSPASR